MKKRSACSKCGCPGTFSNLTCRSVIRDHETLRLIVKHRMCVWYNGLEWAARHGINGHEEKHSSIHSAVRNTAKGGKGK